MCRQPQQGSLVLSTVTANLSTVDQPASKALQALPSRRQGLPVPPVPSTLPLSPTVVADASSASLGRRRVRSATSPSSSAVRALFNVSDVQPPKAPFSLLPVPSSPPSAFPRRSANPTLCRVRPVFQALPISSKSVQASTDAVQPDRHRGRGERRKEEGERMRTIIQPGRRLLPCRRWTYGPSTLFSPLTLSPPFSDVYSCPSSLMTNSHFSSSTSFLPNFQFVILITAPRGEGKMKTSRREEKGRMRREGENEKRKKK